MIKQLNPKIYKNLKRPLLVFILFTVSFLLSGCDTATMLNTETGSTSQGTLSSTSDSFGKSFPVQADLSKTVQIEFTHKNDKNKNAVLSYVLIQNEVPISVGKLSEAYDCGDDHIKPYDAHQCSNEEFTATLKKDSNYTNEDSEYIPPVRILRRNFREIVIVRNPKSEPAEVVFLQKKNPKTQGKEMAFFDVYLQRNSLHLLDERVDRNYKEQLNLKEVLGDCGQLQPVDNPELIAESVQLGGNDEDIKKAAEEKRKSLPPDSLDQITQDKIQEIISLNSGKEDLIRKSFDFTKENNPFTASFRKIGTNLEQNHISYNEQIKLSPKIFNIKDTDFFGNAQMTLIIMKSNPDEIGSPVLQVEKEGKKYIYSPQIASKIIKVVPLNSTNQNLGISAVEFQSQPVANSDPWCGFTPESKPAIYLYPKIPTIVSIKLNPQNGWISASNPEYKQTGWKVIATPSGNIYNGFKKYPYLFYEAMLPKPKMPSKYIVADQKNLKNELRSMGKSLGLKENEANDLADYWTARLKPAPYYQIGIMSEEEINKIEPLSIKPMPQSILRIRLVFKALNEKIDETADRNSNYNFVRRGFTLVEWGGFDISS